MTATVLEFKSAQKKETQPEKILRLCREVKECMRHVLFDLEEDRNLFTSELYAQQALDILLKITSDDGYRRSYTGMLCALYIANMRISLAQQWVSAHKFACQMGNTDPELERLERFKFDIKRENELRAHVGTFPNYAAESFRALELSREAVDVAKAMQKPIADSLALRRRIGTDSRTVYLFS
jgi:hypothetical protein